MFAMIRAWQLRQSPGSIKLATGLSYTTIERWYRIFRERLPSTLAVHSNKLSGVVEVDEAYFGKQKHGGQTIVIGAIERDTRRLRLKIIENTERETLEDFVKDSIEVGSLVVTDCNPGYSELNILGYNHEYWNHSKGHFAGTNHIEQNWSAMKRYMRKLYGSIPTKDLRLILNEWEARHNFPRVFESVEAFLWFTVVPD
jgi:transposase-like protein